MAVSDELVDRFYKLTSGIPGSLKVSAELYRHFGEEALQLLEDQDVQGGNIWFLYSRICGENLMATYDTLQKGNALEKIKSHPSHPGYR